MLSLVVFNVSRLVGWNDRINSVISSDDFLVLVRIDKSERFEVVFRVTVMRVVFARECCCCRRVRSIVLDELARLMMISMLFRRRRDHLSAQPFGHG